MSSPVPPPPAYTPPAYVPPPAKGILPFALGFLAFIGIPYLNLIIAGIVMAAVFPSQDRRGGLAARNARAAANWGLTMALIMIVLAAVFFTLVFTNTATQSFFPLGIVPIVWVLLCIANLVVVIRGLVVASAGRVVSVPAIPFLRGREDEVAL
jgi:hypothetical protein